MIIIYDRPPLWDMIDAKFHVAGRPILFAWGDRIYNPERVNVPKELHAHEEIHGARQLQFNSRLAYDSDDARICQWWYAYIDSAPFRLIEETPAHRAEYQAYCKRHYGGGARRERLTQVASKLAAPLYGSLVTLEQAKQLILEVK